MFLNRESELKFLEKRYQNKEFEFIVIYGRRRVGKTELIKEFLKNRKHIYFLCDKRGTERNMIRFKKHISECFDELPIESNDPVDIFNYLIKKLKTRTVIVLDEFSYLVEKDSSIPSVFQVIIDETLKNSNVMLIVCGSLMSMMEKGILAYKSPLYGRKTGHWKVTPLSIEDSCKFFPSNSFASNIEFWSVLDGIPFYLEKFSDKKPILENIQNQILNKQGRLYEEVDFLLKEKLREPDTYKSILESIAAGKTKVVEIANASNIKVQDLDKYLKVLIRLGIIKKESPVTQKPKTKKTIYVFNDNFFYFWFKFSEPFKSNIEIGELNSVTRKIKQELNAFVGKNFEDICRNALKKGLIKMDLTKIGRWWGAYREKDERKIAEIDLIALNEQKNEILFAECKWQDNVNAEKILYELKDKSKYVKWNNRKRKEHYAVFAKSFKHKIKEKDVLLFDLKDMEKIFFH